MIVTAPNPILRKKAAPVPEGEDVRGLVKQMIAAFGSKGYGLAAPQIGVSKRVIIVKGRDEIEVLVNPVITKRSAEKIVDSEACLSLPGKSGRVSRNAYVTVAYRTIDGDDHCCTFTDAMEARCVQHEIDHLDGILFTDKTR